jgi:hypothetical protein
MRIFAAWIPLGMQQQQRIQTAKNVKENFD